MIARDAVTGVRSRRPLTASVMRAMTLFSGTRVLILLCSVVRIKLVALWIGAAGVGLFGIYNSFIELMSALTQLNVRDSSVRDIAGPTTFRCVTASLVSWRRWAAVLGLFGSLLTLALSPLLSRVTFGDDAHSGGFVWLSVVMLFQLGHRRRVGHIARLAPVGAVGRRVTWPERWAGCCSRYRCSIFSELIQSYHRSECMRCRHLSQHLFCVIKVPVLRAAM